MLASELVNFCNKIVGSGYVYGANGAIYTIDLAKKLYDNYGNKKTYTEEYYTETQMKRWGGKMVYDCSGVFTAFRDDKKDESAKTIYKNCDIKGAIENCDYIPGTFVFCMKNNIVNHIGYVVENRKIVHATSSAKGVVKENLNLSRGWTHYGRNTKLLTYNNEKENTVMDSSKKFITLDTSCSIEKIKKTLMDTNQIIYFKSGKYNITETLYFNSDNLILAYDAVFVMAAPIHNILMSYTTSETTEYNGVHNVQIFGLTIEQMYSKYKACSCNSLTLWHCKDIYIYDFTAQDTIYFHGLEINGSCDITVEKSKFIGYMADVNNDFREALQIDFSSESAIFVHKSGSKCYDNTPCKNIYVKECLFDKSSSTRPSPTHGIGMHSQAIDTFHENINIIECDFRGNKNKKGYAIHLIAVKDAVIRDNVCDSYARFVYINNFKYSYGIDGNKIESKTTDGLCDNIQIIENEINNPLDTYVKKDVYAVSVTGKLHTDIIKLNNIIK